MQKIMDILLSPEVLFVLVVGMTVVVFVAIIKSAVNETPDGVTISTVDELTVTIANSATRGDATTVTEKRQFLGQCQKTQACIGGFAARGTDEVFRIQD